MAASASFSNKADFLLPDDCSAVLDELQRRECEYEKCKKKDKAGDGGTRTAEKWPDAHSAMAEQ